MPSCKRDGTGNEKQHTTVDGPGITLTAGLGESSHTLALAVCWDLEEPANGQAGRCAGGGACAEALRGVVESQGESV